MLRTIPCPLLHLQWIKTGLIADAAPAREQVWLVVWDKGPRGCILCSSHLLEADSRVFCISIQAKPEGEYVLHYQEISYYLSYTGDFPVEIVPKRALKPSPQQATSTQHLGKEQSSENKKQTHLQACMFLNCCHLTYLRFFNIKIGSIELDCLASLF